MLNFMGLSASRPKVLLVESDIKFREDLQEFLLRYGFEVGSANSTEGLCTVLRQRPPDVVILDHFIHGADALPYVPEIRRAFAGHIMILSDNSYEGDRVVALESGADDFVAKGIGFREVVARLRALARRDSNPRQNADDAPDHKGHPDRGWVIQPNRRQVFSPSGTKVDLTGLEFETFLQLYHRRGQIVSRDDLALHVLRRPAATAGRSIENLLSRVRMKFLRHLQNTTFIKAVRGKGYVFLGFE
jgi:two-component system, OmpR family, response regulator